jgi:hypothetical protein
VSTATACPPCVSGKTDPEIPTAPPTDPAGFIYPSYRAALTEAHGDERHLETSHQDVAHVSSAVGGSLSTLSFGDETSNYFSPNKRRGGGIRDRVRGFSRTLAASHHHTFFAYLCQIGRADERTRTAHLLITSLLEYVLARSSAFGCSANLGDFR